MLSRDTNAITRIAIIGVGQVGAALAYALILNSTAGELLLVDTKLDLRDGQVRDLSDVSYSCNSGTRVRAATHHEAGQCDVVVITAGSKSYKGETTIQHMYQKVAIIQSITNAMKPFRSDTILLIVAHPVDLITSFAQEHSGLPASQVLGSGTVLDSVRLRGMLADKAGVAANAIDLQVLGVHGESEVVAWSTATLCGVPIDKALPSNTFNPKDLANECKHRSQRIIQAKGTVSFGIGSALSRICSSILMDKRDVYPISHFQPEWGCCFSLPAALGRSGIIRTVEMATNSNEKADIRDSVEILSDTLKRVRENQ
ncbi:uncharacterized protein N7518_001526 [Penicillium psychrosexuale]|uniref:uncharacterized protein n=1 Tax=Penicillium psychrosexuale TaxID=1002107 RepID=UPI0025450F15|nr:uncharacterized protein N7518_001526 [Penicillium psychrosexuale]KAI2707944.1 hypothetical protein CBS147354_9338 [Penicillium roqueforti]KAI3111396.1 hypothetical protein CBS147333_4526 [Penicillium roqueforti]KAI3138199.1 hypothetical protein CBS147326_2937 [Penicillium roqueforti]KAI3196854.1 hypothetical protein CBS147311_7254 [Penicillium roqueforti]KAI3270410.1 hypothetical protein CBS147308_4652 [Penicillium roqueforti]